MCPCYEAIGSSLANSEVFSCVVVLYYKAFLIKKQSFQNVTSGGLTGWMVTVYVKLLPETNKLVSFGRLKYELLIRL